MGLAFREQGEGPTAQLLHGYPNSSYLWRDVLPSVAAAGYRAVAPDLLGYGDSLLDGKAGTWEDHVAALDAFVTEHSMAPLALVVHDWGGLIGLRWACEHPGQVNALVLMSTGFFPDGRWHGMAKAMRAGEVDELVENLHRASFAELLRQVEPRADEKAVAEYHKGFATLQQRRAGLNLYKSGDFEKLSVHDGALGQMGVPTLLLWGAHDDYAPVSGAYRFKKEIPHAELVVLDDAGHFLMEDDPERVGAEIARFLAGVRP
jgi:haloalkane dehalogenase